MDNKCSLQDLIGHIKDFNKHAPKVSIEVKIGTLSGDVINQIMGNPWFQSRIVNDKAKSNYFPCGVKDDDALTIKKWFDRVTTLGECLYNLQQIEGYANQLARLKSIEDIESIVAELEGAKLFFRRGINIEFNHPVGVKGSDYDLKVKVDSGEYIPCEVTCAQEGTPFSDSILLNKLRAKNDQLPKETAGLLIIKIPESWVSDSNCVNKVQASLSRFFSNSKRIGCVMFIWEQWEQDNKIKTIRLRPEINFGCRHSLDNIEIITQKLIEDETSENWVNFPELIRNTNTLKL